MKRSILKECLRISKLHNTPESHPDWGSYHHYSFIIQKNKIIEWGTNSGGGGLNHWGFKSNRHKIHSETRAFTRARGLLDKNKSFEVVNIRLNKLGDLRVSAPCKCCCRFLQAMDCSKIWFSTEAGWASMKV